MAKTAADYIAEGRALWENRSNNLDPNSLPHESPKSWQQRAVNQGFMEAFQDACDENAANLQRDLIEARKQVLSDERLPEVRANTACIPSSGQQKNIRPFYPALVVGSYALPIPKVVISHLNELHKIREHETDSRRWLRITKKINSLIQKHARRSVPEQLRTLSV